MVKIFAFLLVPLFALIGAPSLEVSSVPGTSRLSISGAAPGEKVVLFEGFTAVGAAVTARGGSLQVDAGSLTPGEHVLRAVEWGTGKVLSATIRVSVPSRSADSFVSREPMATGLAPRAFSNVDLDGDGLLDMVLSDADSLQVMYGKSGAFAAASKIANLSDITGIAVQDFNGDGLNDLAVSRSNGKISILLNEGGRKFRLARGFSAGAFPSAIVTADFNGDGMPDLAVTNQEANSVSIALGKGDGTFAVVAFKVKDSPRALIVADFDGDGRADLAVADFGTSDVSLLFGDGTGSFRDGGVFPVSRGPVNLKAGDFDEDGKTDLAVLSQIDGRVTLLRNSGSGRFLPGTVLGDASLSASGFAIGDVNGDGHLDVVLQAGNELHLQLGRGDGSFTDGYSTPSIAPGNLLALTDIDSDGRLDIAAVDLSGTVAVLSGSNQSGSDLARTRLTGGLASGISTLSVRSGIHPNGSTASSVSLATSPNPASVSQFITLTATVSPSAATGSVTFYDGPVVLGRVAITSGQGVLTLPLLSGPHSLSAFYSGNATYAVSTSAAVIQAVTSVAENGFQPVTSFSLSAAPRFVVTGDFNGDGKTDFVVAILPGQLQMFLNNGAGGFTRSVVGSSIQASSLATGDFNGDGKIDLVATLTNSNSVSVMLGNGNGTFLAAVNYSVGLFPVHVAVADFNHDGISDLASANKNGSSVSVLLGKADGTFFPAVNYPVTGILAFYVTVADFDNDGNLDMLIPNNETANLTLMLGNGDGTFKTPTTIVCRVEPYSSLAADLNGDGKMDFIVTTAHQFGIGVFLGNGNGTFQAPVYYTAGAEPHYMALADFNGDGKVDLYVSDFEEAAASLLLGNGDGTFQPKKTYFLTGPNGTPHSLALADFNADGAVDTVVIDFHGSTVVVRNGNPTSSTNTDVALPDITGLTQAQATTALQAAGLVAGTVTSTPHSAPTGTVIRNLEISGAVVNYSPVAGTILPAGTSVNFVLSGGPGTVPAAELVDQTVSTATLLLQEAGLVLGTVTSASSSTIQAGNIISQSPAEGVVVATGSAVSVVVSTGVGSGSATVPNVVGQTQSAATTSIQSAGLVLGTVTAAASSTVPSGSVISESPAAGTSVSAGSSVNLVVSSGTGPISVPNVVGLTQASATSSIQAAGLVVGTISTATSSTVASGSVISESPSAGTLVASGSSVALVISTGTTSTVSVVSVTPSSGSGNSQIFTAVYSDTLGASALNRRLLRIGTTLATAADQCYVQIELNGIFLVTDSGSSVIGPVSPTGSISNSQCTLNGAGTGVTNSGNTSTVTASITFKRFYGLKNIYLYANDTSGNIGGWSILGTYTAFAPTTKVGFFQPTNGPLWVLDTNGSGQFDAGDSYFSFAGQPGAIAFSGDWNGDGRSKVGYYLNGFWALDYDGNGVFTSADKFYGFGSSDPTYIPVVGDWNGSGTTKIGFYHNGFWALDTNGSGVFDAGDAFIGFGGNGAGEVPVLGDWNGDKRTKVGIFYRGTWVLDYDGDGTYTGADRVYNNFTYATNDVPVAGDWNGDGKTKIGIFRGGFWVLDYNGNGVYDGGVDKFYGYGGTAGDIPLVADWNGDGRTKIGLYNNGFWTLDFNGSGAYDAGDKFIAFGGTQGNQPIVGRW